MTKVGSTNNSEICALCVLWKRTYWLVDASVLNPNICALFFSTPTVFHC